MQELLEGNTRFAEELYGALAAASKGNVFFSPYGLSSALAMLGAGARGATRDEMSAALRLPLESGDLHGAFGLLAGSLKDVTAANALWVQRGLSLVPEFETTVRQRYGATLSALDFSQPEAARDAVNGWVREATRDRIRELLTSGDVDALTRLIVTNAVYFKGKWNYPFDASLTQEEPFSLLDGRKARAPLMRRTGWFDYHEDAEFQAVSLPYSGTGLSMLVVLPRGAAPLPGVARCLEAAARLQGETVEVFLPRFTLTGEFRAEERLKALGMRSAFEPEADFSGATGARNLFVSAAIHKSFVAVDEAGTEAAAATAVVGELSEGPRASAVFRADRPFVFLIRDDRSGTILFLGRLVDPR